HHRSGANQRIDRVNGIGNPLLMPRLEEFKHIDGGCCMSARLDLAWRRPRVIGQSIESGRVNLRNDDFCSFNLLERPNRDVLALRRSDPVHQPLPSEPPRANLMARESINRFRSQPACLCGYFRPSQLPAVEQIALVLPRARPELDERTKGALLRLPNRAGVQ